VDLVICSTYLVPEKPFMIVGSHEPRKNDHNGHAHQNEEEKQEAVHQPNMLFVMELAFLMAFAYSSLATLIRSWSLPTTLRM
jgi:hypothetical protein